MCPDVTGVRSQLHSTFVAPYILVRFRSAARLHEVKNLATIIDPFDECEKAMHSALEMATNVLLGQVDVANCTVFYAVVGGDALGFQRCFRSGAVSCRCFCVLFRGCPTAGQRIAMDCAFAVSACVLQVRYIGAALRTP